jgi:hypothetical protein
MSTDNLSPQLEQLAPNSEFGPYYNVVAAVKLVFDPQHAYIVGIAGGYNAHGLIGTECNGIFILDYVQKKVVLDQLACQRGCFLAIDKAQATTYSKLRSMKWGEFRDFVNAQPRLRYPLVDHAPKRLPVPKVFQAAQFASHVEGKFWTAKDKAKWANNFVRFVQSGCSEQYYDKQMYEHLHLHMGFIAHYNQQGFWDARFATLDRQLETLEALLYGYGRHGDPRHTWSDVSQALAQWLRDAGVLEQLAARRDQEHRDRELSLRDALIAKHGLPAQHSAS